MATKTAKANVTNSTVKITDGKLILSLPNAQMPVVWQMDLGKAQSSSFSIKENKKEKSFALISKNDDGKADEIASFDDKDTAVDILMQTSETLQKGSGQATPSASATNIAPTKKGGSDKLGAILAALLVVVLLTIWMTSASVPNKISGLYGTSASSSINTNGAARSTSGVAVSAEDFLSNR